MAVSPSRENVEIAHARVAEMQVRQFGRRLPDLAFRVAPHQQRGLVRAAKHSERFGRGARKAGLRQVPQDSN
jgi:hypothetical protein